SAAREPALAAERRVPPSKPADAPTCPRHAVPQPRPVPRIGEWEVRVVMSGTHSVTAPTPRHKTSTFGQPPGLVWGFGSGAQQALMTRYPLPVTSFWFLVSSFQWFTAWGAGLTGGLLDSRTTARIVRSQCKTQFLQEKARNLAHD